MSDRTQEARERAEPTIIRNRLDIACCRCIHRYGMQMSGMCPVHGEHEGNAEAYQAIERLAARVSTLEAENERLVCEMAHPFDKPEYDRMAARVSTLETALREQASFLDWAIGFVVAAVEADEEVGRPWLERMEHRLREERAALAAAQEPPAEGDDR